MDGGGFGLVDVCDTSLHLFLIWSQLLKGNLKLLIFYGLMDKNEMVKITKFRTDNKRSKKYNFNINL